MKNTEEPIPPLSPLAKKYLWVFIASTIIGLIMVFLSVAGRRQQLIEQTKAGTLPQMFPNQNMQRPEPTEPTPQ